MISWSSTFASSAPATSANVTFGRVAGEELGLRLPELECAAAAGLQLAEDEEPQADDDDPGQRAQEQRGEPASRLLAP